MMGVPRPGWSACGGCGVVRRIHSRGLCRGCWDVRDTRDAAPHGNRRVPDRTPAGVEVRNAVFLANARRLVLARVANRIAARYGPRVDPDELIQVGYVGLLDAADGWRGRGNLWTYARVGVVDRMEKFARRQVRDGLYLNRAAGGEAEDETYARLCGEWLDRLRGRRRA